MKIIQTLRSDWGEPMHTFALKIAKPIAAIYVAGFMVGEFIHGLNDRFTRLFK